MEKIEIVAPLEEEKFYELDQNDLSENWRGEFKSVSKKDNISLNKQIQEHHDLENHESIMLKSLEKNSIKLVNKFWQSSNKNVEEDDKSQSLVSNTHMNLEKYKLYFICSCIFLICVVLIFVFYRRRLPSTTK